MRQGQQNRRGRGRNRKGQSPLTRSFESTGPDVKLRGTPAHIAEKYMSLARDASSSGDPVLAENYLQHAEHYNRIIMAFRDQHVGPGGDGMNGGGRLEPGDEFGDDDGDEGDIQPSMQPMRQNDHSRSRAWTTSASRGTAAATTSSGSGIAIGTTTTTGMTATIAGQIAATTVAKIAGPTAAASRATSSRRLHSRPPTRVSRAQSSSRRRTTRCAGANRASRSRATSSRSSCAGPCVARAAKATVSRMATATLARTTTDRD